MIQNIPDIFTLNLINFDISHGIPGLLEFHLPCYPKERHVINTGRHNIPDIFVCIVEFFQRLRMT